MLNSGLHFGADHNLVCLASFFLQYRQGPRLSALAICALWKMCMDGLVHKQANSAVPSIRNETTVETGTHVSFFLTDFRVFFYV